jgi:hypothetical protein
VQHHHRFGSAFIANLAASASAGKGRGYFVHMRTIFNHTVEFQTKKTTRTISPRIERYSWEVGRGSVRTGRRASNRALRVSPGRSPPRFAASFRRWGGLIGAV